VRVIVEVAVVSRLRVVILMGWGRNAVVFVVAIVVVGIIRVGDEVWDAVVVVGVVGVSRVMRVVVIIVVVSLVVERGRIGAVVVVFRRITGQGVDVRVGWRLMVGGGRTHAEVNNGGRIIGSVRRHERKSDCRRRHQCRLGRRGRR
jgi:hypothetical protein